MNALSLWAAPVLAAATPSPSPSPSGSLSTYQVTPGLAGFIATFALAVVCVLLFLSLTRHLRRATHNARDEGLPIDEKRAVGLDRPSAGAPADASDDAPADASGGLAPDDSAPDGADGADTHEPDAGTRG